MTSPTERHEKAVLKIEDNYRFQFQAMDDAGKTTTNTMLWLSIKSDFLKALAAEHLATKEEIGNALIDQIRVAILAQETGIKDEARLLGIDKWLDGAGIIKTKYQHDKLEGQKDLLRWLEKGYFPALLTPPTKTKE